MRVPVWLVAASIIVVSLLTGVIVGVAVDRRVLMPRGPFMRTGFHRTMVPGHLEQELGLTPKQSAAVDSIMRHRMSQRDSLMAHTWPIMRQLLDSTRSDIESVLTPEQREKFERLRFREPDGPVIIRRGGMPGGMPPPPE